MKSRMNYQVCFSALVSVLLSAVMFLSASGCGGSSGNCSVTDNGDGTSTISCPDGSSVVISNGQNGQDGQDGDSCTVTDNGDGTKTISCTDGTTVTVNDGQDGGSTLVVNEILQDGDPNCPNGGIAVHTGVDTDGNGLLEGDEIASTSYLCNGLDGEGSIPTGILQGSYTIRNSLDADWLSSITSITGDLDVDAPGISSLSLPALTFVVGNLDIRGNNDMTSLDLTNLTTVGGYLSISTNTALTSLDLTALMSVGGYLYIHLNYALTSLEITALTSVGGDLIIQNNAALTILSLPALTSVGGNLNIVDNAILQSLAGIENITSVGGYLRIIGNTALTSLSLPVLTALLVDLYIQNNPVLCNSFAIDLRDQLIAAGWSGTSYISGNDDSC